MTPEQIYALERPHPALLTHYVLRSLLTGPLAIVMLPVLVVRYYTLRYRFDDQGIHAQWGLLFRREINLTYARIQDIHLSSNIVERWFGLARIQVQTASGSSGAEMTIEGIREFEALRDFLYSKMRGTKHSAGATAAPESHDAADLAHTLREVAAELRALRLALESEPARPRNEEHQEHG